MSNDDRDRPTDPGTLKPESTSDSVSVVIPKAGAVPSDALQPNPCSYQDYALSQLLERARGLDAEQASLGNIAQLLDRQKLDIYQRLDESDRRAEANHSMVARQVQGLVRSVDATNVRLGHVEVAQESSSERMERLELDMSAFREQVEQRMVLMTAEIETIKRAAG